MIWYRARKSDHKTPDRSNCPQWESDNNLEPYPFMGLYEEYLEMGEFTSNFYFLQIDNINLETNKILSLIIFLSI